MNAGFTAVSSVARTGAASVRRSARRVSVALILLLVTLPGTASEGDRASPQADKARLKAGLQLSRIGEHGAGTAQAIWLAAHEALGLHAIFGSDQVALSRFPDESARHACLWTLQAVAGSPPGPLLGEDVSGSGTRLSRRHAAIQEDYLNAEAGLRHTIRSAAGPIASPAGLEFRLETGLSWKIVDDGRTLLLYSGGEWVIRYRLTLVLDGQGHPLDPRMDVEAEPGTRTARVRIFPDRSGSRSWTAVEGLWDTPKAPTSDAEPDGIDAPPPNDLCPAAEVIPSAGPFPYRTSTVSDVTDATTTGDPPAPSCQPDVSRSIWYRFTPGSTADYTFSTCSNNPANTTADDTVIAVYASTPDGDCGGLLGEVPATSPYASCDDDSCTNEDLQSELTVQLESGTTYFIVVWQFGTTAPTPGNTAVQLHVSQANVVPPPPANDTCDAAELVPGSGPFPYLTTLISDITGAKTTGDPSSPSCAPLVSRSVWYAIAPSQSANYTFSTCADAPTGTTLDDTVVAVYSSSDGSCSGSLEQITDACDDDTCVNEALQATITASLQAGRTYHVVVWERGTTRPPANQTAVQLRVSRSFPPPPPANDLCSGAEVIPDGPYPAITSLIADITGASTDGDPAAPSCGGTRRARSVWYRFVPSVSASYTISSCSGDGVGTTVDDTIVSVYAADGTSCNSTLTEVTGGCDDDGCFTEDAQATVTVTLQGNTTYYILLWQKGSGVPATGNTAVQLNVTRGALAPANDGCGGAVPIPDGPYPVFSPVTADISGASAATDPVTASCQSNRSRGVWYRFTPGTSGYYRISTCSGDGTQTTVDDTILALYTSPAGCAGPFTEAATELCRDGCDDDSCTTGETQSSLTTYLDAGQAYYVLVWKYGTTAPAPGRTAVQVRVESLSTGTPPANDDCAAGETIPPEGPFPYTTSLVPDVTSASCVGDPPVPTCEPSTSRSVWYRIAPTRSGLFTFSSCADAPTATTVDDTVIGVYRGLAACGGSFAELGCDDDSCAAEPLQAVARDVRLETGSTYYVVVWKFGTDPPVTGNTALQLRVEADFTPVNDRCEAALPLALDVPANGTTISANDSYRLEGSNCFTGIGQTATTAPGRDVTYAFTAPADGTYSFKVTNYAVGAPNDLALYVAQACTLGPSPATVTSCLAAANRNTGGSSEELPCLPLSQGQTVYVTVDNADAGGAGSDFTIEVNRCGWETEPNGDTTSAMAPLCGVEGSIAPGADVDFYTLGTPASGSRVFAIVDGVAANPSNSDFDLRVTTASDTLEYDDANNDAEFGNVSPNVGGTKATGVPLYLRVTQKSSSVQAEPYRLYSVIQGSAATATAEVEPNDSLATANAADYISATLPGPSPSSDVDLYRIEALRGDLWVIGLDGDPGYDNTPLNAKLEILDSVGSVLMTINDSGSTGSSRTPAAGLTGTTQVAPAESLTFRAPATARYFVRVSAGSSGANTSGDYLLSIAPACQRADADGDGVPNVTDCARDAFGSSPPGAIQGLTVARGSSGELTVSWQSQDPAAGAATAYDVVRGDLAALRASGFPAAASCAATGLPDSPYVEPASGCPPGPGAGCWHLVRGTNGCGKGTYGAVDQPPPHPLDGSSSPCP